MWSTLNKSRDRKGVDTGMVYPAHSEIQAWIECIPRHIQRIIRCKGENEYEEDRMEFKRSWAGTGPKGKLSKHISTVTVPDYKL
jgi:hypothetical protein